MESSFQHVIPASELEFDWANGWGKRAGGEGGQDGDWENKGMTGKNEEEQGERWKERMDTSGLAKKGEHGDDRRFSFRTYRSPDSENTSTVMACSNRVTSDEPQSTEMFLHLTT